MSYPHVVPNNIELILTIIGEELKSCKFFSTLRTVGLDDAFYQTNLCSLILAKAGFEEETNELLDQYFNLLSHYSKTLEATDASVRDCAFQFYMELVSLKKWRGSR
jgi:hypothetical protein